MQKLKISKWGNSQGIRLPKKLLDTLGFSDNDTLEVEVIGGRMIVSKSEKELKASGMLSEYANPELHKLEEGAWEKIAVEKYASRFGGRAEYETD